ncbi:MAG TPA: four helix bundle protein [Anditalea sp.]|nr:four helix bundle protein [Anditalea sp.]
MHSYKELNVWQKAIELAVDVYEITDSFPQKERFGLISQINRSVVSIPSNIAEGAGRNTKKDFDHILSIALGSSFELETQLLISNRRKYFEAIVFQKLQTDLEHIQNMLAKLKQSLNFK